MYQLYKEAYTPWEWLPKLQQLSHDLGMEFFSSPFDMNGIDFLEQMNVPAYKIASFEITDIPFIKHAASKKKPIIISTGIATLEDIGNAVDACREVGNHNIALLKCTSSYPAPIEEANLLTIPDMAKRFNVVAGLSDHSLGDVVATTATALGARIVEKHFILDRNMKSPDAAFSMEPHEFKTMVRKIRETEAAMGRISYELSEKTLSNRRFSRSLFIVRDIKKGDVLTTENLRSIRPAGGLAPVYIDKLLGKVVNRDIERGTPMKMEYVD